MKKSEREELKRLAEEATPGPWTAAISSNMVNMVCTTFETICETGKNIDDALYISAANPAAILSLLAYVDRLEAQRDRLLNACKASITVMDLLRTTGDDAKSWYAQDRNGAMVKVSDVIKSCKEAITEAESEQ